MIHAKTMYTLENLSAFNRITAREVDPSRIIPVRVAYLFSGAAFIALSGYYAVRAVYDRSAGFTTILIVAIALYLGIQALLAGARYDRYFAKRFLNGVPEDARLNFYSFEEKQVVVSNRLRSSSFRYDQFTDVISTEHFIFLYVSKRNGYVMEKAGIEGPATEKDLLEFLNRRLNRPVTLLSDDRIS